MVAARSSLPAPPVPNGWAVRRLGDVGTIVTGGTPPTADPANYGADYLFVSPGDINDGKYVGRTEKMLSRKGWELARHVPKSSVLFVCIGSTIGKCGLAANELSTNQQINAICPSPAFSADFIYYAACLAAPRVRAMAGEQAVPIVNKSLFASTEIVLPPMAEQKIIAAALSDVDALLEALDQLIAKKRDLKQAAMQQLLTGQTRLPGFSDKWEIKRLGEIGRCLRGVTYAGDADLSPHDTAQTKRLLRSNNVQEATVVTSDVQFVNAARVDDNQILTTDDILICMANGSRALVGKAGRFSVRDGYEYTFGAFMGCFRTQAADTSPAFAFYLFQTHAYRSHINILLAGSSINNLTPSAIESLGFALPSPPEQLAIAEVLSDMDTELAALEQRRDKTRLLKEGMMQELLTGRTRLV